MDNYFFPALDISQTRQRMQKFIKLKSRYDFWKSKIKLQCFPLKHSNICNFFTNIQIQTIQFKSSFSVRNHHNANLFLTTRKFRTIPLHLQLHRNPRFKISLSRQSLLAVKSLNLFMISYIIISFTFQITLSGISNYIFRLY